MEKYTDQFPQHWLDNPNILYHGTSNIFEDAIDKEGIKSKTIVDGKIIDIIMDIYQNSLLDFFDHSHGGGLEVIKNYYQNEINRFHKRPISFAYHPTRCTLYASKDFAGGEHIRAIYRSLKYFDDLIRNEQKRYVWEEELQLILMNEPPGSADYEKHISTNVEFPLEELKDKFQEISHVLDTCSNLIHQYQYGVIYAIDFSRFPTTSLSKEIRGIYTHDAISTEMIVGKIIWTKDDLLFSEDSDHNVYMSQYWNKRMG